MMKKRNIFFICAASALASAYLVFENNALQLTEYDFSSRKVTSALDGFKICHLSDIHVKSGMKNYSSLIKKMSEQSPDIIVLSGDLVDSRDSNIPTALALAETLADIAPVYYVTGNHEERLSAELYLEVMDGLRSAGIHIMDGRAEAFEHSGETLNIAGLFDSRHFDASSVNDLFDKDKFNILINHRPQFAREYAEAGADLTFAGHAHGGQARLPIVGGVISPDQFVFPKYYDGIHCFGDRATVISRGIGNSLIPMRINNRPEVVAVTLRKL